MDRMDGMPRPAVGLKRTRLSDAVVAVDDVYLLSFSLSISLSVLPI
jgi:hypothetical protein